LPWHRDLRDNAKGLDWRGFYDRMGDPRFFNQFHIALEADECLWVVPGSHARDDTETERRMFPHRPILVDFIERDLDPWYDGADKFPPRFGVRWAIERFDKLYYSYLGLPKRAAARRRNETVLAKSLDYCRAMPGAVRVELAPGDLMIYRNSIWHTAIYRADVRRMTLFSNASTPESLDWLAEQRRSIAGQGPAARWFSRDQME
jgi:ectoine hydroxylase-related dioxygenase (phytanoyl-CoA dioxygenase family)